MTTSIHVNSPYLGGRLPLFETKNALKSWEFLQNLKISHFWQTKFSSLFIVNFKISLFLNENLPLWLQKRFTCMQTVWPRTPHFLSSNNSNSVHSWKNLNEIFWAEWNQILYEFLHIEYVQKKILGIKEKVYTEFYQ